MTELAIPEQPAESGLESAEMLAQAKAWLADQTTGDLVAVAGTSKRVAAVASAARRVGVASEVELDYAEAAREAERRLGQLLEEGRAEGTVASEGRPGNGLDINRLADLGIEKNLAADASAFATINDDDWRVVIQAGREQETMARTALRKAVARRLDELAGIEARERDQVREAERLAEEREEILAKISKMAAQPMSEPLVEADLAVTTKKPEEIVQSKQNSSHDDLRKVGRYVDDLAGVRRSLESLTESVPDVKTEGDEGFHLACRSALSAIVALSHEIGVQINARESQPRIRSVK